MAELMEFELSKDYMDQLKLALEEQDSRFIRESMAGVNPADITTLLHEFDTEDSKFVVQLLEKEVGADIISGLDDDTRNRFLNSFLPEEIATYVDYLDSDDAADIINQLPVKTREEVIANLENEEKAAHIKDLLRYEEDCAGGLMAKELIKANINWNILQCIDEIRRQAENVEKIYSVYVVDDKQHLLGIVSLKRILLAGDDTHIADIYNEEVISVETFRSKEEVASIMQKYDLEAIPVVNLQGKLVGRITVDDVIDVITELADQERQYMSGISEDVEYNDSVWMLSRARLPWLIVGMVGGILGARFIGIFEDDIALLPSMAFFIPLITATGGNVGIQSSSIVVQSLVYPSFLGSSVTKRLLKVVSVAILNGLVLALLVLSFNILLGVSSKLSLVVSAALFCVVLLASVMGTVTPLVLEKLGINPALASGPFITTANDLLGLGVYFGVAHILFGF